MNSALKMLKSLAPVGLALSVAGLVGSLSVSSVEAAAPFRFLKENRGQRISDLSDDYLESVRIRWDEDDPAVQQGVLYHVATTQFFAREADEIIPFQNNLLNRVRQQDVRDGIIAAYREWNNADADLTVRDTLRYDYTVTVPDPRNPSILYNPRFAAVDRVNLITFQEPSIDLGGASEQGQTLALTLVTYFNQDYDMSNPLDLPDEVIDLAAGEVDGYTTLFATVDFDGDGVADVQIPARKWEAGHILDADIVFNSAIVQWDQWPQDESQLTDLQKIQALGSLDVQAILTHEIGHTLGLAHSLIFRSIMTPATTENSYPYDDRAISFDDIIALRMNYEPPSNGLGGGIIEGRIIDGATEDGFNLATLAETIQYGAVFVGRPNNDAFVKPDDIVGAIDDQTSVPNKIRLLAQVFNGSEDWTQGLGVNAPPDRINSRYMIPGLPPSDLPFKSSDRETIPPGPYVIYAASPEFSVEEVQELAQTASFPAEFYGGAVPWLQPGSQPLFVQNQPNDRLIQDGYIQVGSTISGQPGLRIPNTDYTLVGFWDAVPPVTSFLTYRIVEDGQVQDLTNIGAGNLRGQMVEALDGSSIDGTFVSFDERFSVNLRYEIGRYRTFRSEAPPTDGRLIITMTNLTTRTLSLGARYTLLTALRGDNNVFFSLPDGTRIDRETVLSGAQVPSYVTYAPDNYPPVLPIITLDNPNVTRPTRVVFANNSSLGIQGALRFDYPAANAPIGGAAFASIYDPVAVGPGESRTMAIAVGYVRQRTYVDGPITDVVGAPGSDDPNKYRALTLSTGQRLSGIDILTNTGLVGGLLPIPTEGEGPGQPTDDDQDGDGILDGVDNCPLVFNPDQADRDLDGVGDACDPDSSLGFEDVSPGAPGSGQRDVIPGTSLTTLGATFGDVDNDGYPDLVLANAAGADQSPEATVNRLYINIPAPTATEPGARRLVDRTFGINGRPQSNEDPTRDDRMPFDLDGSFAIILADFDNDGDLDMYVSNFTRPNNPFVGAQNRFYRNDDVDDSRNPSPDTDSFGDGFFSDVTSLWDPGILNTGAFVPYPNTFLPGLVSTLGGGRSFGFDVSTRSAAGDIDNDGDIDIIVSNQNIFGDNAEILDEFGQPVLDEEGNPLIGETVGTNLEDGSPLSDALLRFSERVLINRTLDPSSPRAFPLSPRRLPVGPNGTHFTDETLGADSRFGYAVDRMPPLFPEFPRRNAPGDNGFGESDFSYTQEVKLSPYYGPNRLGIIVFNQRNPILFNSVTGETAPANPWDGNEVFYVNTDGIGGDEGLDNDVLPDGFPDGAFSHTDYGVERFLVLNSIVVGEGEEATTVSQFGRIGLPEGINGDQTSPPEENIKQVQQTQSYGGGMVADLNQDGWPEVISLTAITDHSVFTNFESPIVQIPVDRTRMGLFGQGNTLAGIDTFPRSRARRERFNLTNTGRPRQGLTVDLNLDGIPDMVIANDTQQAVDFAVSNSTPGFPTFWLNFDNWGLVSYTGGSISAINLSNGISNAAGGVPLVDNGTARRSLCVAAADIDLDGDIDLFFGNGGQAGTLLKNNLRLSGVPPTLEPGASAGAASQLDIPLFVDQSYRYMDPYMGTLFDPTVPGEFARTANSTIGAAFADFNGSKFMDLATANGGIGSLDGELQVVYRNNGNLPTDSRIFMPFASPGPAKTVRPIGGFLPALSRVPAQAYDVLAADFSGDGFADLMYASASSPPRYFANFDSDVLEEAGPLFNSQPDDDDIPDGVFAEVDVSRFVNNTGDPLQVGDPDLGEEPVVLNYDARRYQSRRMAAADFDQDGRLDFVLTNGLSQGAPNVLWMNRSDVDAPFTLLDFDPRFQDETDTRLPRYRYTDGSEGPVLDDTYDVMATDVDNDGDVDIVFVNRGTTDQLTNENFFAHCRLLINNPDNIPGREGFFAEVVSPEKAPRMVGVPILGASGVIVDSDRWPMSTRVLTEAFAGLSGDLSGKSEPGEDRNGNRTVAGKNRSIDDTEDLNGNRILDFTDRNGNNRHDLNIDLVILTRSSAEPNIILANQDRNGDGFGDGFFADETGARFAQYTKLPSQGGDIGDVNGDGLNDLVIAVNTQGAITAGPRQKLPVQLFLNTVFDGNAGRMVDVSVFPNASSTTASAASQGQFGELPLLKVQFADGNPRMIGFPGNAMVARLVDVDLDGDLDIFIGQAGRLDTQTRVGHSNHMLINLFNPANENSRQVLSSRDNGGPIIISVSPGAAVQGRMQPVEVQGLNISEGATFSFGPGISIAPGTLEIAPDRQRAKMVLIVDQSAAVGVRRVRVTNPDTTFHETPIFRVLNRSLVPQAAVEEPSWKDYE